MAWPPVSTRRSESTRTKRATDSTKWDAALAQYPEMGTITAGMGIADMDFKCAPSITKALQESKNNRSRAARLLGITRSQLYSRMQKHRLGEGSAGQRG